jgi:hypothetical protein
VAVRLYRIPIQGWRKCIHAAAAFESKGEYAAAILLDESRDVTWWMRNDPAILRIPTPAGFLEPDFVYLRETAGTRIQGMLEIKGDVFWDGEGSDARIKSRAACEWVRAANRAAPQCPWTFAVVLDEDAVRSDSLEGLLRVSLNSA